MTLLPRFVFQKNANSGAPTANPAKAANLAEQNGGGLAGLAELAAGQSETAILRSHVALAPADNLLVSWRDYIDAFLPQTEAGKKLRAGALTFLRCPLAKEAIAYGWDDLQLFSIMSACPDADIIERRSDLKGVIAFVALAPWRGTKVEAFSGKSASIVTGYGGRFTWIKREFKPEAMQPFWFFRML